jgi:hypothetical protein
MFEIKAVLYKKIPDIDMSGFWAARIEAVFLELNRALVVLIEDILIQWISLGLQKLLRPNGYGK